MIINELCDVVRETSFAIHKYYRNGHMEKVYDEDGTVIGDYFADLFIQDCLIVELKACRCIAEEHIAQILGYLKSARIHDGLLINFGASKLFIKKYVQD